MTRTLKALMLAVALALPVSGCAAVIAALPQITAVVTDALVVLNIIDNAARDYFDSNPMTPPHVQRKYTELYRRAVVALKAAQDVLRGTEGLSQEDYDRAFQQFREAYGKLRELLERNGPCLSGCVRLQVASGPGENCGTLAWPQDRCDHPFRLAGRTGLGGVGAGNGTSQHSRHYGGALGQIDRVHAAEAR